MDIFSTAVLVKVLPNLKLSQNFLLDTFFPEVITTDKEEVAIDVIVGKRRMSPFVSPKVEGKLVESLRQVTSTFKPAYIKDKRAPDLMRPVKRRPGEAIAGSMSAGEREMANLATEMEDQIDMLNRRLEWMAASALTTGTVTIAGDGFPTTVVDFGRDAALTVALTGGNRWGQSGISPASNIETWITTILKKSGAGITDIVFTPGAWDKFIADDKLKSAITQPVLLGMPTQRVDISPKIEKGGVLKGMWGNLRLWLYNDWYVDDNNVEQPMLADGTVILSGPAMEGVRAFGAIIDPKFNYGALAYAPKTWVAEDPAQRFLMMQSAPIVIPSRVNAALAATVI